jgi:hypothetical protein
MTAATEEAVEYTRLHITPLDPGLLPVVLSGAVLPRARNISYHELATLPDKRYGFVDLPSEDATKLRKKLNGAVLKGQKISVEPARVEQKPEPLGDEAMSGDVVVEKKERKAVKEDKVKKRKRKAEEIPGVELEDGRKVKRGWTVAEDLKSYKDKEKRKQEKKDRKEKKHKRRETKSKYTEHPECLIKAVLPTKVVETGDADEDGKKKRKRSKTKEVVVHEFAKTTKFPTFLKSTVSSSSAKGKGEVEFVDGKGWVDEDGNVVEAVKTRAPAPVAKAKPKAAPADDVAQPVPKPVQELQAGEDGSDGSSRDNDDDDQASEVAEDAEAMEAQPVVNDKENESLAARDTSPMRASSPPPKPISTPTSILKKDTTRPSSSSSAKGLSIKIPPATPGGLTVHPLEALYKRSRPADGATPAQDAAPEAQPFSFFGNGDVDEDTAEVSLQIPLTPFSRQDFENRGVRSAAPTPDTAHPSRMSKFWPDAGADGIQEEDEEDDDDDKDEEKEDGDAADVVDTDLADNEARKSPGAAPGGGESTSDFQKWFWEHRGDLNRSWKKRRKTAAKEKRYRENRARAERAI